MHARHAAAGALQSPRSLRISQCFHIRISARPSRLDARIRPGVGILQATSSDANPNKRFRSVAGETLAKLMDAPDAGLMARQNIELLTDEFFIAASTFLDMAKKEKNVQATERLEIILRASHEAKLATLRPEIQLLNRVLAAGATGGSLARAQMLSTDEARQTLALDNGYFIKLCQRMMNDIERKPEYAGKAPLLVQLRDIEQAAQQSLAAAGAAAPAAPAAAASSDPTAAS